MQSEADSVGVSNARLSPLPSTMSRPLSIGMLAPCPFPTHQGTQVLIRHIATALTRAGHDVHLVSYGYGESHDYSLPFHVHRSTNKITSGLRSGPHLLKPAADAALLLTASRVVRTYNCDLLHVHNVEGLGVGALLKLQTALPVVYHAHNAMGPELPTYFRAHMAQAFASVVGDVIDRTLPRAADAVITFDNDHKALHEIYGVSANRIHVIPPGLDGAEMQAPDPRMVARMQEHLGDGEWILYAGNPDGYQNLPLLWAALHRVRQRRPDVRLLVASNHAPEAFEVELREAPSREGIVIRGFSSLDELKAMFRVARMGVSPRNLWTGVPIKLLNYLAAGLPAVSCRASGRHILTGSAGCIVDDTPEAFADGILELLERPARSRAEQRRSFERFRIENHVSAYEDVYRTVLASTHASVV